MQPFQPFFALVRIPNLDLVIKIRVSENSKPNSHSYSIDREAVEELFTGHFWFVLLPAR